MVRRGGVAVRLGVTVLCAGLLGAGVAGCASTEGAQEAAAIAQAFAQPAAESRLEKARRAFDQGHYGEAQRELERIVRERPEHYEARLLLAEVLLRTGQAEPALEHFTSTTAAERFRALALQGIGLSLLHLGDAPEAATQLRKALELDGMLWRAYSALGWIHDARKEWSLAELNYRRALAVVPESAIVHNNLGMSYLLQRRFAAAVVTFRRALELDPSLAPARANLRIALASQGHYAEALAGASKEALPDALNDVGYLAMMRGDYEIAEGYFSRAMRMSPSYHNLAARNLESLEALKATSRK
jgi:Flp pilus assembly protein TadD